MENDTGCHFTERGRDGAARIGTLLLGHGEVSTPAFMPVGTRGSVRAMHPHDIAALEYRLILANCYHLYLRPGIEVIEQLGGLHRFANWPHNILTDSGGFQIFSLSALRTIEQGGISFQSHIDGSSHRLTPAQVVELQAGYGSDIMMPLDVCTPYEADERTAAQAVAHTSEWLRQSVETHRECRARRSGSGSQRADGRQVGALFGIVQGNFFPALRAQSAAEIVAHELPGYAIGGLSVGEPAELFSDTLNYTAELLPEDRPRYVMGIGTPDYILAAVAAGIDMFDCVLPTRIARNGSAFTADGIISMRNAAYRFDDMPIDPECPCNVCAQFSRGYLRHLVNSKEILAPMLISMHNLAFMGRFMDMVRAAIEEGRLQSFSSAFMERYTSGKRDANG